VIFRVYTGTDSTRTSQRGTEGRPLQLSSFVGRQGHPLEFFLQTGSVGKVGIQKRKDIW